MSNAHSFHIPVMGIGFTIDTPLKVSHLGIDSVISLVDDVLLEKLRKVFSQKFKIPYFEISEKMEDYRAKRITSYLNLLNSLVDKRIDEMKSSVKGKYSDFLDYFDYLSDQTPLKKEFLAYQNRNSNISHLIETFKNQLVKGSIDVNIMTKVDKINYKNGKELPQEFNDAHAALRGFANSNLNSSVILSAGMNPRLYAYMESFPDFYPDKNGILKKKIVLKVSDFKSALIQGKYLAKRGLWVSEYRIESGLNCGGHAFASDGLLIGPILNEFKQKRADLYHQVFELLKKSLESKNYNLENFEPKLVLTYQGGVGTYEEHEFLKEYYQLDSVGWGTPFLLVEGVTAVDQETRNRLIKAEENDLYLSNISPLGVPFNTLRGNTKDAEKQAYIAEGRPGSDCPRKFVKLNTELTKRGICTASRAYQNLKIKELDKQDLSKQEYQKQYNAIVEKDCICAGLGTSALKVNGADFSDVGPGVSVCPGPNMAYFDKQISLKDMIGHIYGKTNVLSTKNRPHVFIKEMQLYVDFLKNRISAAAVPDISMVSFADNLLKGISFYIEMFNQVKVTVDSIKSKSLIELEKAEIIVENLRNEILTFMSSKELDNHIIPSFIKIPITK